MGEFSFHTSDTEEPIYSTKGHQVPVKMVYLLDGVRMVSSEENYEGYGVFGGVDYYDALALMNQDSPLLANLVFDLKYYKKSKGFMLNRQGKKVELRDLGITLYFDAVSRNNPHQVKFPQLYVGDIPEVIDFTEAVMPHENQGWYCGEETEEEDW